MHQILKKWVKISNSLKPFLELKLKGLENFAASQGYDLMGKYKINKFQCRI